MRRFSDILLAVFGALIFAGPMLLGCAAIWFYDRGSPFYISWRIGRHGRAYRLYKLRSMTLDAAQGPSSSGSDDRRITPIGRLTRRLKLDEAPQILNVLLGDMSFVGPRPQVAWAVADYTKTEQRLLTVRPGITDPASIVFSDQDELLRGAANPDLRYSRIIRPWKNRLALLYVEHGSVASYWLLIVATTVALAWRPLALRLVGWQLRRWGAPDDVTKVALRQALPPEAPPPGSSQMVEEIRRDIGSGGDA